MDRNDRPHDQVPAVRPSGQGNTPAEASGLAQRIWDRYVASPGVISRASTLRLFRRIGRFSGGRLPLLADVRRRWVPMDILFPRGLSALPYAWLPASSGTPSYAAPLDPERVPRHAGSGRSTHTVGQPGLQRAASVRPAEKPAALDRPGLAKASRGAIGRPVSLREGARLPEPAAREGQRAVEAQEAMPAAISADDLRITLPRRHGGGSEGQTIQPKIAGPEPVSVDASVQKASTDEHRINGWLFRPASASEPERHSGTGPALYVDSLRRRQPVEALPANSLNGYEALATISTSDLGATILRRHLSGPAGRTIQRKVALPEPAHSKGRMTAEGEEAPLTYPVASVVQYPAGAQASMPTVTGSSDIGAGILQRRLAGSAGQDIRHTVSSPDLGPLTNRMPLSLPAMHLVNGYHVDTPLVQTTRTSRGAILQTKPEVASGPSTSAPAAPPATELPTAAEPASATDVTRLADQVYEILVNRLATERERRGL